MPLSLFIVPPRAQASRRCETQATASRQATLAFRSLDPFRALREPDRRRRDEERPFRSKQGTGNKPKNHLTEKPPYKSANLRSLLQAGETGKRCCDARLNHICVLPSRLFNRIFREDLFDPLEGLVGRCLRYHPVLDDIHPPLAPGMLGLDLRVGRIEQPILRQRRLQPNLRGVGFAVRIGEPPRIVLDDRRHARSAAAKRFLPIHSLGRLPSPSASRRTWT